MIKYCTLCFLPSTKPDLYFNDIGLCAACISFNQRNEVDWSQREKEFHDIIKRIRATSKSKWDCIVPVSGGKDSTFQVLKVLELGLNPLCVTSTTCDLSKIGRENIENIKRLGVDYMEFSPNPVVRAKLNKIGLEQVGDISWAEHVGIFTIPVRAAVQFGVPLIIWGENSQNEYGGPAAASTNNVLNRRWLEEFGGLLGLRVSDLSESYGIRDRDLVPYTYPTDDELALIGVTGLFLGHYFPWDGFTNYFLAQAHGFKSFGKVIEGSVVDYENLDNHQTGIHDYFKFLKFGFGRATDLVSVSLRRRRITRNQGLELIKLHDGKYPWTYLDKPLESILDRINLTVFEFDAICDRFTNRELFLKDKDGELIRDSSNSLIKINYENLEV
jgi:N-acetyl sugar amidotransferase